tara:strand:- start:10546 stop:11232 length:687 start_codon:yes stop_codon:yes gene_type:complete
MVNIDDVYQKVLAIANKEQRGYVTPQEFNLFANQAQMDIFEQYFYDINQFNRIPGNHTEYSDMLTLLEEKISIFKSQVALNYNGTVFQNPQQQNLYRLGTVLYRGIELQRVDYAELLQISKSPLVKPTESQPVFYERADGLIVKPNTIINKVICTFIKKPAKVSWGYSVIGETALYDATKAQNFELHISEENNLVLKILALAGIMLQDPGVYQIATAEDQKNIQQQKS